jgi:hypothetical protein
VDGLQTSSLRVAADGQLVKITGVCLPFPRALHLLHHEFSSIGLVFAIALRFSALNSLALVICEQQVKNIGAILQLPYPNFMASIFIVREYLLPLIY